MSVSEYECVSREMGGRRRVCKQVHKFVQVQEEEQKILLISTSSGYFIVF